jgi:hypothetical protein
MYQLVYVSSAERLFTRQELLQLLEKSRVNNTQLGITGMLLYRDGNIMQVLEGEEAVVLHLFERISRDSRHKGVIVLLREQGTERMFPEWTMGFRDLDSPEVRQIEGYSEFLNEPLTAELGPDRARRLLTLFKKAM